MKTILFVVALCATVLLVRAQDVEAPQLNQNDLGFKERKIQ
ncbi:MAG TPA: hypothetical protein PLW14_12135 [Chlorobiota bacterium]|nr:hypothetical protein [Chlorobiota bacterium]